ncbi:MAG TPA: pitrilysin family protein [Thermoanaerobaculia bacterium]|nr:pitrilysin family protein [Thermoanaerobaculia bacterium]
MRTTHIQSTLFGLALLLTAASAAPAQTPAKKAAPPAPKPIEDVKFPAFQQKALPNGLRVVVIEHHEQPAVTLRLVLDAGKSFEPAGKAGLSAATAALLNQGTESRSAQQIAEAIDFIGGSLGASASIESGFATAQVTSDQIDRGLELLADIILRPTFPDEEIERWRRQALSGLQISQEDPSYLASAALARRVYGEYPYGRPGEGTPESLRSLTRDDLVSFHKRYWVPNEAILAVVGDVRAAEAFTRVEKHFGGWAKGSEAKLPPFEVPKRTKPEIIVIDKPDAVQTEIRIGQVAIPYRDPDYFKAQVYNAVLGANSSARLFNEIRNKRGLSYGAGSWFREATNPGWFQASTFSKTESTVEALKVALEVIRSLEQTPVPDLELTAAKRFITGSFPLEIETPNGIATRILEAMQFGLGKEFLETYNEKIQAVTAADVKSFAEARIQPETMVIVLAGNASAFSDALKKEVGEFQTIPYREVDLLAADLRKPKQEKTAAAPVSAADSVRALELAKKAQNAMGGKAFVDQRTQITRGTGSITPPGAPQALPIQSIVSYRILPDKERTEITLPMGQMVQVFDGTAGWVSMAGQTQDQTAQMKDEQFYGLDVLRRIDQPGYTVRPLPEADVNGKKAPVIEIADSEGHATVFTLDPETSLVLKASYERGGQETEAAYTDYRDVNGIKVAHQTNASQNGQPLLEIKLSEVQINPEIDPGLFKKPEG